MSNRGVHRICRQAHTHAQHTPLGTVQYGTLVPWWACWHAAGILSGGKGGGRAVLQSYVVVQVDFGGDTGGVDWLCSVPKVPATVLGAYTATVLCRDTWGTTTTCIYYQDGPG